MLSNIQCVPLATEPGISLIILPLMRILQQLQTHTTDTFLFISHTTNVLLFKFRCNIFIGVRIIKEMPGSVASGTPYRMQHIWMHFPTQKHCLFQVHASVLIIIINNHNYYHSTRREQDECIGTVRVTNKLQRCMHGQLTLDLVISTSCPYHH